jgi:hypothetical protein
VWAIVLLKAFQDYFEHPSICKATILRDILFSYNNILPSQEMVELRQQFRAQPHLSSRFFRSSGSTGEPRQFSFGPCGDFWLRNIENYIKHIDNKYVFIRNSLTVKNHDFFFSQRLLVNSCDTIPTQYVVAIRLEKPGAIAY